MRCQNSETLLRSGKLESSEGIQEYYLCHAYWRDGSGVFLRRIFVLAFTNYSCCNEHMEVFGKVL